MEDAGASAVVLHSLFEEQIRYERYELNWHLTHGTEIFGRLNGVAVSNPNRR